MRTVKEEDQMMAGKLVQWRGKDGVDEITLHMKFWQAAIPQYGNADAAQDCINALMELEDEGEDWP
jgi:hypothetical protein